MQEANFANNVKRGFICIEANKTQARCLCLFEQIKLAIRSGCLLDINLPAFQPTSQISHLQTGVPLVP